MTFSRRTFFRGALGGAGAAILARIPVGAAPPLQPGIPIAQAAANYPPVTTVNAPLISPEMITFKGVRRGVAHYMQSMWLDAPPPSFVDFIEQELGKELFPFQRGWAEQAFPANPALAFAPRDRIEMNTGWDKGTGKTSMAAWTIAYSLRVVLAMRDPWAELNHPVGAPIDLIGIGASAAQSKNVLGSHVRAAIAKLPVQPDIVKDGVYAYGHPSGKGTIFLSLLAPSSPSIEGRNPVFYALDGSSTTHPGAYNVHELLWSSARTRFVDQARGFTFNWY